MDKVIFNSYLFEGYTINLGNGKLLVIKAKHGALVCGYINMETAEKLGDAVAMVTGVNSYDDMLNAKVKKVSSAATKLGVCDGMIGSDALAHLE